MKNYLVFFLILLKLFFIFNIAKANQTIKYINIDLIIENTLLGKKILNKINKLDKDNINKLRLLENELKNQENDINLKKNLLSEKELKKEIDELKKKIENLNNQKNKMVKEFTKVKNNELQFFFKTINPVIENYMMQNSIDILLNSKNIFIGSKNLDLTENLIQEINKKLVIKNDKIK